MIWFKNITRIEDSELACRFQASNPQTLNRQKELLQDVLPSSGVVYVLAGRRALVHRLTDASLVFGFPPSAPAAWRRKERRHLGGTAAMGGRYGSALRFYDGTTYKGSL